MVGEPAYHLLRNMMLSQHQNQWPQSQCMLEMSQSCPPRVGLWIARGAKRSVMENVNFCLGLCIAIWRLEFGAGLRGL